MSLHGGDWDSRYTGNGGLIQVKGQEQVQIPGAGAVTRAGGSAKFNQPAPAVCSCLLSVAVATRPAATAAATAPLSHLVPYRLKLLPLLG